MRLEVSLTKAEAAALCRRDVRYPIRGAPIDYGPTIDWGNWRKSKARRAAERKLLAALASQGVGQ